MKFRKYFLQTMQKNYPSSFEKLMREIDDAYATISTDIGFVAKSNNPMDKRLDFSAYFLALIQILEENGESFDQIKKICLEVTTDYVKPKNKVQQVLKQLPPKLIDTKITPILLKMMDKKIREKGHAEGFVARVITDKEETYGFGYGVDILECGICKLFAKHNKQNYVSILCEVDKLTSSLAGLELIRTGTIANGAERCDFRFQKQ